MNPITQAKNLAKLNERELGFGVSGHEGKSWHQKYKDSAWIFVGGLPYDLTEGDIICVFSQYGEVVNINLIRDHTTGKSRGFCFLCYEDQRSTILAVDNLNTAKVLGRILRVDHVEEYKVPKLKESIDPETKKVWEEGCAPKPIVLTAVVDKPTKPVVIKPESSPETSSARFGRVTPKTEQTKVKTEKREKLHIKRETSEESPPEAHKRKHHRDQRSRSIDSNSSGDRKHESRRRRDEKASSKHHHESKQQHRRKQHSSLSSEEDMKRRNHSTHKSSKRKSSCV